MANGFSRLCIVAFMSAGLASAAEGTAVPSAPPARITEPASGVELVFVKGGCYAMGDIYFDEREGEDSELGRDERPVHEVCVGDLYVGTYEVTRAQWKAVMGSDPSTDATCAAADCPVTAVSWEGMHEFLRRLNARAGAGTYRLPTEAEWEYAARSGGKSERYAGGKDVDSVSWFEANSGYRTAPEAPPTHPVGGKAPNGLGLFDMSGNVYEVTSDWYGYDYYAASPRDNPKGPAASSPVRPGISDQGRVRRGGCATGAPGNSRTARRNTWSDPIGSTGFRLFKTP